MCNVDTLYRFCDRIEGEGLCLEASQVRFWLDCLGDSDLRKIDSLTDAHVRGLTIVIAIATVGDSQLKVRQDIREVLEAFERNHLDHRIVA